MKVETKPEKKDAYKIKLLRKWFAENPKENYNELNHHCYYVSHILINSKNVGFIAFSKLCSLKSLDLVYVDPKYRGKGYLKVILKAAKEIGFEALHAGLEDSRDGRFAEFYAECGFAHYSRLLRNGEHVGNFYLRAPIVAWVPIETLDGSSMMLILQEEFNDNEVELNGVKGTNLLAIMAKRVATVEMINNYAARNRL